jgi:hypothetical protein
MNSGGRKEQKIQNSLKELFIKLDKHEKFDFTKFIFIFIFIIFITFFIIDVIQKIYIILLDILLMKLIFKKT